MTSVLAADVGRTTCRVARFDAVRRPQVEVMSGASLADPDGPERIGAALRAAEKAMGPPAPATTVVVGTTGLAQAPAAGARLAAQLARTHPGADIVVASDVLTAHVGALGGHPGVCLVAGTGAVALALTAGGRAHLVDGHGYLLGDAGSGFDVGRAGLRAALRHHDGRPDGSSDLAAAAGDRFGPLDRLPGVLQSDPDAVREIAGFAVDVATAARAGDPVARAIWSRAADTLAATVIAACRHLDDPTVEVGLTGSLIDLEDLVTAPVTAAVTAACPRARLGRARGDALEGARQLAGPLPGLDTDRLQAEGLLLRHGGGRLATGHPRETSETTS